MSALVVFLEAETESERAIVIWKPQKGGDTEMKGKAVLLIEAPVAERSKGKEKELEEPDKIKCTACTLGFLEFDTWELQCGHSYCRGCLIKVFNTAITGTDRFPPRCYKIEIAFDDVEDKFFTQDFADRFKSKALEITTPNSIYCGNNSCSKILPTDLVADHKVRYPDCSTPTCVHCKQLEHTGACQTAELDAVIQPAQESGWQQCYKCNHMVKFTIGCDQMTRALPNFLTSSTSVMQTLLIFNSCRCSAQFCYACGQKWKTCRCAQWNEKNLLTAARRRARRDNRRVAPARQAVVAAANKLRRNHECRHPTSWDWIKRTEQDNYNTRCEYGCYCPRPIPWILECPGCQIRACVECARNRLH